MADSFALQGATELQKTLLQMVQTTPKKIASALYEEAQIEMREAKRRTPWKTGTLRGTGIVNKPERDGNQISVTLSFGGPAAPYAIYVHENLEAIHPHGEAKFLESTLLESAPHMANRIVNRIAFK